MKTTVLNPADFKDYNFQNKPKFMNLKEYINGYKEVTAVYITETNKRYTITKKINKQKL